LTLVWIASIIPVYPNVFDWTESLTEGKLAWKPASITSSYKDRYFDIKEAMDDFLEFGNRVSRRTIHPNNQGEIDDYYDG
jgi:hypothetical protein